MEVKVIKRNGSLEDFDQGKIARVVTAAGLTPNQAETLAANITEWVKATQQNQVTTLQIRDQVVYELQKLNKYAADLFVWYEKTKEKASDPEAD